MRNKNIYTILQNLRIGEFLYYNDLFSTNYNEAKRFVTFNTVKYENIIEIPQFRIHNIHPSLKNITSAPVKIMFPLNYDNIPEFSSIYSALSYLTVRDKVPVKISIKNEKPYIIGEGFILDSHLNPYMIITLTVELFDNVIEVKKINIRIDPKVIERDTTIKKLIYNRIVKPFYEDFITVNHLCPEAELVICNLSQYITVHENNVLPNEDLESLSAKLNKYLQTPEIINSMCDLL